MLHKDPESGQHQFVIGAMGSSVTASHDNCNYDSYERQLERTMQGLWSEAGVQFKVRNAGQGGGCGDSYKNQVWCVQNMVGRDVDVVHYSWTYFEAGDQNAVEWREALLRWALLMPHSPALHVLNVGDKYDQAMCGQSLGPPKMADQYAKFGANAFCMQPGIRMHAGWTGNTWGQVGDGMHTTTRYGEAGMADKDAFAAKYGFRTTGSSGSGSSSDNSDNDNDLILFGFENNTEVRSRNSARGALGSLGVMYRNWHPGPLGFQVAADAFAFYYTHALLRAVEMIEEVIAGADDDHDRSSSFSSSTGSSTSVSAAALETLVAEFPATPRPMPSAGQPDAVPPPLYCKEDVCGSKVTDPPGCINFEKPTHGRAQIFVMDPESASNPMRNGNTISTENTATGGEADAEEDPDGWHLWAAGLNPAIPRGEKQYPECQHLDRCAAMKPNRGSTGYATASEPPTTSQNAASKKGWITFALPTTMRIGRIFICCCCGKDCVQETFIDSGAEFVFDGKVLTPPASGGFPLYPENKCMQLQAKFSGPLSNAHGHLYLSVRFANGNAHDHGISHVVAT